MCVTVCVVSYSLQSHRNLSLFSSTLLFPQLFFNCTEKYHNINNKPLRVPVSHLMTVLVQFINIHFTLTIIMRHTLWVAKNTHTSIIEIGRKSVTSEHELRLTPDYWLHTTTGKTIPCYKRRIANIYNTSPNCNNSDAHLLYNIYHNTQFLLRFFTFQFQHRSKI